MKSDTPEEASKFLQRFGIPAKRLAQCDGATRIFHDLGIYGDDAIEFIEELAKVYEVDLTDFEFDRYFPPEFHGRTTLEAALLSLIPFGHDIARRRTRYLPLTVFMLDRVIRARSWGALRD